MKFLKRKLFVWKIFALGAVHILRHTDFGFFGRTPPIVIDCHILPPPLC